MVKTSPPPNLTNSIIPPPQPHQNFVTINYVPTLIPLIVASVAVAFLIVFIVKRLSSKPDPYLAVVSTISNYIKKRKAIALVFYIDTTDQRLKIYPVYNKVGNVIIYINELGETNFSVIDPKVKPLQIRVGNMTYPVYFAIAGNLIKYIAKYEDFEAGVKYDNINIDDPRLIEMLSKETSGVTSTYYITPSKKLVILASPDAIASVVIKRIWSPIENSVITIKEINENITKLMEISARMLGLKINSRTTMLIIVFAMVIIILYMIGSGMIHLTH